MRSFCSILIVIIVVSAHNLIFGQIHFVDSVKIEFVGFNTETFTTVSCGAFPSMFKGNKVFKTVKNRSNLNRFTSLSNEFKQSKSKSLDVRGQITFYRHFSKPKYCFDTFGYFYIDGKLYYNKQLLIAIADALYNNHPKYLDTLQSHE